MRHGSRRIQHAPDRYEAVCHAYQRRREQCEAEAANEWVRPRLEQVVRLCEVERAEHMEQPGRRDGRQPNMAFGSVESAERIAEAIRGLANLASLLANGKSAA